MSRALRAVLAALTAAALLSSLLPRPRHPLPPRAEAAPRPALPATQCRQWCLDECCSTSPSFCAKPNRSAPACVTRRRRATPSPSPPPTRDASPAAAHEGYCAPAKHRGDCEAHHAGFWDTEEDENLTTCAARCQSCARCTHVSFIRALRLCSWHAWCDLADLRRAQPPLHAATRRVAPPLAPSRRRRAPLFSSPRVAIVTLAVGGSMRCGLPHWCERAAAVGDALPADWEVTLRVLGDAFAPADCAEAVGVRADSALVEAARACPEVNRTMLKWQVFALDADVVLFADVDYSFPRGGAGPWPERVRQLLRQRRPIVASSGAAAQRVEEALHFVGRPDSSSPINTGSAEEETPPAPHLAAGLFLALPSEELYREGLALLLRCGEERLFSLDKGWEHVGRPRELQLRPRYLDGPAGPELRLAATAAYASNSWDFVCAQYDQGFFWHLLYVRHRAGGYWREEPRYRAIHWAGVPKPWRAILPTAPAGRIGQLLPNLTSERRGSPRYEAGMTSPTILRTLGMVYTYLASTTLPAVGTPQSRCAQRLWALRRAIESDRRFAMLDLRALRRRGDGAEDVADD